VDDGPHLRESTEFDAAMMFQVFQAPTFRLTAFGYLGHMGELYAFWSLVGMYLTSRMPDQSDRLVRERSNRLIHTPGCNQLLWFHPVAPVI
jgi:hypothetical protein